MPELNFFWDPLSDNILQERDETGAVTAEYTAEPGLYGNVISQNRGGVESQYHYDAQGSTLAVTDDNQNVTDTFAYSAFGEVTERTGTNEVPFQYIGQKGYYTDSLTGQTMVRRRPYEPARARWLAVDPVGDPFGRSQYAYALNAPLIRLDPSAMQPPGGDMLITHPVRPPMATEGEQCGGARASVYWSLKDMPKGVNGWIVQGILFDRRVCFCRTKVVQRRIDFYFEAWQVVDGLVYDGQKNATGTNLMPPLTDNWIIRDRGLDTKGWVQIAACVMFLKDYKLLSPPWKMPGEPGHEDEAQTLPTLTPDPIPAGFKVSLAKCGAMESRWNCCKWPVDETEVFAGGEWE
jgi:RHS repeat-associated protein